MANVNVTFDDMRKAATTLTTGKVEITNKLADLKNYIAGLVSAGFVTDKASKRFSEMYDQFTKDATGVVSSLDGIAKYLNEAATALEQTDQDLAAAIH